MKFKTAIINGRDFSENNSRFSFLLKHYKKGNVLDVGNVGDFYGREGALFSSHAEFVVRAVESTIYGFDLYLPKENSDKYKNQLVGNIEEGLPYEDAFFDTVYLGEVIEHLSNHGFVLQEISRVLKADGVLIMDTPNAYSTHKLLKWFLKREENLGDPTHIIIFTPGSLVALLKKNGFDVSVLGEKHSGFISGILGKGTGSHLLVKAIKTNHLDIAE